MPFKRTKKTPHKTMRMQPVCMECVFSVLCVHRVCVQCVHSVCCMCRFSVLTRLCERSQSDSVCMCLLRLYLGTLYHCSASELDTVACLRAFVYPPASRLTLKSYVAEEGFYSDADNPRTESQSCKRMEKQGPGWKACASVCQHDGRIPAVASG